MSVVSLPQMLEAGVHFGHQTRRWNPKMRRYIFTDRNGIHIIDLTQTAHLLDEAYSYLREASDQGKKILFVGTKRQAAPVIAQEAKRCGMFWVNQRWLGGMLTNWDTIRTSVDQLKELETMEANGTLDLLPKKEASVTRKKLERLTKYLGGLKNMRRKPDILLVVDQRREQNAVMEARRLNIPIVSLLDTNCDPDLTDVGIPANDDAIRSIRLIVGKLADAIYEGRHGQLEDFSEEEPVPAAAPVAAVAVAVAAPAEAESEDKGEVLYSFDDEEE
ncbi:30S ribosomal protein S2 [Gloeobacter violaceus]|uniref:Small ribosomal subunit protein uS2 n=1 Tax=Gloeobacter violaceus (strain ATCC 29082 / PCC 7421) TaxID=251221 RepID=RS2_GLOVI|nr:30S ribosomal protein S2 [Gloeobacter violaceus]Q7NJK2.1 RecName: Full=Small ribosomal subunit protein uS2; AltName: Full=30S ribosomal protein S2 [Gloeobacter violaceus PCC 7421]BAC89771.1 30S ribosomal protein S2 [Gloeobacter violaceus PCC 7421]